MRTRAGFNPENKGGTGTTGGATGATTAATATGTTTVTGGGQCAGMRFGAARLRSQ
ncbi:MAG: hypothetical protein LBR07_00325 [Puniceicoccales bacterium]|nr:hypothetical protein [Puniceicoccales bacterium]